MAGSAERSTFKAGERTLFLLGNGPSLKGVDLAALSPHATLGMNAAYRYWREIGWRPRFYACLDMVVGLSHRNEIAELIEEGEIERFLLRDNLVTALGPVAITKRVVNFDALCASLPLLRPGPITTGSHAALWAACEGYQEIVLLGIDGNYVERVKGARAAGGIELEIVEDGANPNYFFEGYQRKGDRYNIPNPRPGLHVEAWEVAAALLRDRNVDVVNANPNSEVRFFPFVDVKSLLSSGAAETDEHGCVAPQLSARALLSPQPAPRSIADRLRSIVEHQRKPLAAASGLAVVAAVAAALLAGRDGALSALVVVAFSYLLALIMLAARDAVSDHIGRLDNRIATLEAALRDTARRGGAAHEIGDDERA